MIIFEKRKFACVKCKSGHRNATCDHLDMVLTEVKAVGRPQGSGLGVKREERVVAVEVRLRVPYYDSKLMTIRDTTPIFRYDVPKSDADISLLRRRYLDNGCLVNIERGKGSRTDAPSEETISGELMEVRLVHVEEGNVGGSTSVATNSAPADIPKPSGSARGTVTATSSKHRAKPYDRKGADAATRKGKRRIETEPPIVIDLTVEESQPFPTAAESSPAPKMAPQPYTPTPQPPQVVFPQTPFLAQHPLKSHGSEFVMFSGGARSVPETLDSSYPTPTLSPPEPPRHLPRPLMVPTRHHPPFLGPAFGFRPLQPVPMGPCASGPVHGYPDLHTQYHHYHPYHHPLPRWTGYPTPPPFFLSIPTGPVRQQRRRRRPQRVADCEGDAFFDYDLAERELNVGRE